MNTNFCFKVSKCLFHTCGSIVLIYAPNTPLINENDFSPPNCFASSTASLTITFRGCLACLSSYIASLSTARSAFAIFSIGNFGESIEMKTKDFISILKAEVIDVGKSI